MTSLQAGKKRIPYYAGMMRRKVMDANGGFDFYAFHILLRAAEHWCV